MATVKSQTEFNALARTCATPECGEPRLLDSDGSFLSDYCLHCVAQPLGLHLPVDDAKNREADAEADMIVRANASKRRMRVFDSKTGHRSEDEIDARHANNAERLKIRTLAEQCSVSQLHKVARDKGLRLESK